MPATPVPRQRLASDVPAKMVPLLPTVVVGIWKGGAWKTSLAVAIAERLALGELRVLLVTVDKQEDARPRLGVKADDPKIAQVTRGAGSVTIIGLRGSKAVELLYRTGPGHYGLGTFDIVVMDTPPEEQGATLPGVLLVAPIDGADGARNLLATLPTTPANTDVLLVRVKRADPKEWQKDVNVIERVAKRPVLYVEDPLPASAPVVTAHNTGRSVWSLPRRGCTWEFLIGVETIASVAWSRLSPKRPWQALPPPSKVDIYVPGWDDDDAE